jgi:hypothetical protein
VGLLFLFGFVNLRGAATGSRMFFEKGTSDEASIDNSGGFDRFSRI